MKKVFDWFNKPRSPIEDDAVRSRYSSPAGNVQHQNFGQQPHAPSIQPNRFPPPQNSAQHTPQRTNNIVSNASATPQNKSVKVKRPAPPPPLPRPTAPPSNTLCRQAGLPTKDNNPLGRPDPEEEMLQQLSCPICIDLFTDPVLLPCLHSLCRACADIVRAHTNPFMCPECKQSIGLEPLKRNFPLNNMVDIFKRDAQTRGKKEEVQKAKSPIATNQFSSVDVPRQTSQTVHAVDVPRCTCCPPESVSPPTVVCLRCEMTFCDRCLNDFHPTVETTPDHPLIPVDKIKSNQVGVHRFNVQTGLCDVMGSMNRVHAEMLQNFRVKP